MRLSLILFVFWAWCFPVMADVSDTLSGVFSPGIRIGTPIEALKIARENLLEGPKIQGTNYQILMDIQAEAPQAVFWYLVDEKQVVGYLRIRAMKTESGDFVKKSTADIYRRMCGGLGKPRQEQALRGGPKGFAKVRVDEWDLASEDGVAFLIATNQDIMTGFVRNQTYPLDELIIKPDPEKFPITDRENSGLLDIPRPENVDYGIGEKTRFRPSASDEATPKAKLPAIQASLLSDSADSGNHWWMLLAAIALSGIGFYLFRKPRKQ